MNPKAPRIAALVAAPLLVVGATALVMLPRGGDEPPPASPDGPKVTILRPAQGAILPLERLQVLARAEDPDGIAFAELRVDGEKVDSELTGGGSTAELSFVWVPKEKGDALVTVRARDNNNLWGDAVITVSLGTGVAPLPPPPTTAFPTTLPATTSTTAAGTSTTGTTTTATTTPPRTTVPVGPTSPPTQPPTQPPTAPTSPPTSEATTTTTAAPPSSDDTTTTTATTEPPTTPTVSAAPATFANQPDRCRPSSAFLFAPRSGSDGVSLQPSLQWGYFFGGCTPVSQVVRLRYAGGGGDVALDGAARAYTVAAPLPPCTRVRWDVIALDSAGRPRGSRAADFTTAC